MVQACRSCNKNIIIKTHCQFDKNKQNYKRDDILFVPGKILGTGNLSHKITLSSFSISTTARNKIVKAGGNIMVYSDMIKKFPTGKGVIIFG